MPSHPELVAAFREGVRSGALPPGLTASDPAEAGRRFAVYRNNVAYGLAEALAARFPVVQRLVGEGFFRALARAFAEARPPASPVLLAWGEDFPPFLDSFRPARGLPYLSDVARLELARGRAYHAADAEPLPPEAIARLAEAPEKAQLGLHPSVQVLASRFAVLSIWRANQPGQQAGAVAVAAPETALVLRDRSLDVLVRALGPGDAALLAGLRALHPLLACAMSAVQAEPGHDPAPLLSFLTRTGAFVAPDASPFKEFPP